MSYGPYYCKGSDESTTPLITIGSSAIKKSGTVKNTDNEFRLKNKTSVIDVVNDFCWTSSPIQNTDLKVPYLYATELRQLQNSLVSSALYYINAISNSDITSKGTEALDMLIATVTGSTSGGVSGALKSFKEKVKSFISAGVDKSILSSYLNSYLSMYLTERTGFRYSFPFFEGKPHSINNSWGSSAQVKSPFHGYAEEAMNYADTMAATVNIMAPGTYIEKPKYFQYPADGESVTMTFPLLNTIRKSSYVGYQQNYELLWILAYQNKPFRTSFSRILPPKLYTVTVPGMKFLPYAYISNMDVQFLGSRRKLPVNTPKGEIITSIPEAYQVSITFTSLIADVGNLMVSEGFRAITVSTAR
jgi:hypothetical protein